MRNIRRCLILSLLLATPASIYACLWDYDTLRQERSRFPSTLEVITGKFLRHSPEFYEWRVQDRTKKLEADPNNLAYLDDLAVAYHKLGKHDKAIEIMQRKDKISPNLYETEANISTFYFFAGDLQKSLFHVNRALAINPNAHFGREKYQKYLIEYILTTQGSTWWSGAPWGNFAIFITWTGREPKLLLDIPKRQEAIKAVLGMMRFADYKAPILLEALASLLTSRDSNGAGDSEFYSRDDYQLDAKRLASRAYLRASQESSTQDEKAYYLKMAEMVLVEVVDRGAELRLLNQIQGYLQDELIDAERWYANVRSDEVQWIEQGKDVDAEFDKKYYKEPETKSTEPSNFVDNPYERLAIKLGIFILGSSLFLITVIIIHWRIQKTRRADRLVQADYDETNPIPSEKDNAG